MKSLIKAVALAAVLAVPAVSFAQSQPAQSENGPVTREQVRNELKSLESVGWRPNVVSPFYPSDYQAAQARLDAQSGYGSSMEGTSQSGAASSYSAPVRMVH